MTSPPSNPNVDPFVRDALSNDGYLYSTNARLSSRLANKRLTDATLELADFEGRRVLDVGCGDGTYTRELVTEGGSALVHGVDPAEAAVSVARRKTSDARVRFLVSSAYKLPYRDDSFDAVLFRGVLHHMDRPVDALREALRVAPTVTVIEPNGYNLGLKFLEKFSTYHVEHGEKSYAPLRLDRWMARLGARIQDRAWVGFVPMFSPDWFAKATKRLEPVVERVPVVKSVGCAVYAFTAVRTR